MRALQSRADTDQASVRSLLRTRAAQGQVGAVTPLWIVNAVSVTATPDVIAELAARPEVAGIASDDAHLVVSAAPAEPNIATVQAPAVWGLGDTGQGVVVATLDSGVDVSHPDLATGGGAATTAGSTRTASIPTVPTDLTGHGTATMGVILGGDDGGTSIGVAPGARWIAARIFDDRGAATVTAVHQAFQWLLDPDHDPATADAPQVVNGSWSLGTARLRPHVPPGRAARSGRRGSCRSSRPATRARAAARASARPTTRSPCRSGRWTAPDRSGRPAAGDRPAAGAAPAPSRTWSRPAWVS